jgi:hypothetical protein
MEPQPLVYRRGGPFRFRRPDPSENEDTMSRNLPAKMDAPTAWKAWTTSGSPQAAAQFLERIRSWTDGTAAQLTRGAARHFRCQPTRDQIAAQLHHELEVLAAGEPVAYLVALDVARRNVIEGLGRPAV